MLYSNPAGIGAAAPTIGVLPIPLRNTRWKQFGNRSLQVVETPAFFVFTIFFICWGALLLWIKKYGVNLPFNDEYDLVSLAIGKAKLSFEWLWFPANEHRNPLLRLYIAIIGQLSHWNFRVILMANAFVLGLGTLTTLFAARSIRGHSAFSDCFLPLVLLSPSLFETVLIYSYSYIPITGCLCAAVSLVATGAIYHSRWACMAYGALALVILLGGGPAGQLWFAALLTALPFLWVTPGYARLRYCAALVAAVGSGIAVIFILNTPHVARHEVFRSPSLHSTYRLALRQSATWLGAYPLKALWPTIGIAVLLPYAYVLLRGAFRMRCVVREKSLSAGDAPAWIPLAALLGAGAVLAVILAVTRGWTFMWASRYHCLLAPNALAIYLLLVRFDAPRILPNILALTMLVCYGWNWQPMLITPETYATRHRLEEFLRNGDAPLSGIVVDYYPYAGVSEFYSTSHLLKHWIDMRSSRLSVFHQMDPDNPAIALFAKDGQLDPGLAILQDPLGADPSRLVVRPQPGSETGAASYKFRVAAREQQVQIWVRCRAEAVGGRVGICVDNRLPAEVEVPLQPKYLAYKLVDHLTLAPGEHTLELRLNGPKVVVDLVEIVRQPSWKR